MGHSGWPRCPCAVVQPSAVRTPSHTLSRLRRLSLTVPSPRTSSISSSVAGLHSAVHRFYDECVRQDSPLELSRLPEPLFRRTYLGGSSRFAVPADWGCAHMSTGYCGFVLPLPIVIIQPVALHVLVRHDLGSCVYGCVWACARVRFNWRRRSRTGELTSFVGFRYFLSVSDRQGYLWNARQRDWEHIDRLFLPIGTFVFGELTRESWGGGFDDCLRIIDVMMLGGEGTVLSVGAYRLVFRSCDLHQPCTLQW